MATSNSPRDNQISKDGPGFNNPIPLSPQWLQTKPGENKTGVSTGENQLNPYSGHSGRPAHVTKSPGNGEEVHDVQKRKDVFRPSVLDAESGRRDRWRDEERETNTSVRRDRWREGDKELGDHRKVDRWTDNPSVRQLGEVRRAPPERWTDSSNKDNNHDQRRETKWNTRWGPDHKEDSSREKWLDHGKDASDVSLDKGFSHHTSQGKDEKDGDHYRPWRSNSFAGRGKADSPHQQTALPNKQISSFIQSQGRGRGENVGTTFSLGRGRVPSGGNSYNNVSNYPHSPGSFAEKGENYDPSPLRYSRTKLLDIYRNAVMGSLGKMLDGIAQVPSLTQEEPVEPLAFCVPSSEELVVIEGIDKGDVLSSGVTQSAKDGSVGRGSIDNTPSRRTRLGSREDIPVGPDGNDMSKGKEDGAPYRRNDQVIASNESSMPGISSVQSSSAWRSLSMKEHTHAASLDGRDVPSDGRSRTSDFSWPQSQKDLSNNLGKVTTWGDDQVIRRQLSAGLDREQEQRTLSQPPPEELVVFYKDPRGETQGPFSGADIIGWFEGGYFGLDLLVRLANAPTDMPFTPLGDVMPHLRSKARPPPGFAAPKQDQITDAVNRPNISNLGKLPASSSEVDMTRNDVRYMQGSTDVASRFLESLMSGNMNTPAENYAPGIQSYYGSGAVPSLGTESGDNLSLLVQRMALERQSSLPNPNKFWPGRDAPSVGPKSEYLHESSQQSNIPSSITDNPRSQLQPQNVDFLSILEGLSEKSFPAVNNGASGWSNFPVQGGSDPLQDQFDMLRGQNVPPQAAFQLRLQSPNQPSLTSLLGQGAENISGMLNHENLLSSGLSQDPQLLSLLQQQYLMQLQSQSPAPSQQLYVWDKLRLLQQQQQKQEEQRFEISSSDVACMVRESAPEFCLVYAAANDRLQSVRPATLKAEKLSNPETMLPDVSVENSKQDNYISCQSLHDDKDFTVQYYPFSPKDPDAELKRLKYEPKQTIGMYKSACREAARAKKMVKEVQQWKQKEAPKYEQACLAHEGALVLAKVEKVKCRAANEAAEKAKRLADMEAQRRLYAELKVRKDAEAKKRVLNVLSKNDVRYKKYALEEIEAATNKLSESYDPVCGARPIRRWLERKGVTELSRMLVRAEVDEVPQNFRQLFFVSLLLFAGSVATRNNPNGSHHKDGNTGGNRNDIRSHVGDIDVAAVLCGFGRTIGNKGAVGLRMRVYDRILCFVNCHFASHLEAVNRRNADFDHVYRRMFFSRPSNLLISASVGVSSSIQVLRGANVKGIQPVVGMPELSEADMVVYLGDFNYRLDGISYDEARDFISQRSFDWLRERDQLQAEMKCGNVFQGMREAVISFPPTHKFEHQPGLAGYDYGEKKCIPAWCDRILYRDSCSTTIATRSLDCPVIASVLQYDACMDVTDSDHKPVRCLFDVEVARVDNSIRRQQFGEMKDSIIDATRTAVEEGIVPGSGVALLHARRMASGWYFNARTLIFYPGGWTNEEFKEKTNEVKNLKSCLMFDKYKWGLRLLGKMLNLHMPDLLFSTLRTR